MKLIQRNHRGPWYVRFAGPNGEDVKLSTGETDKQIARIKGLEKMREYLLDQGSVEAKEAVNKRAHSNLAWALERCWRERWSTKKSKGQFIHVIRLLQKEVGHWPVEATTYSRLSDYAQRLIKEGKAHATINRRMSAICTALKECVLRGELQAVPPMPHFTENNIRDRYLSDDEETTALTLLQKWEADAAAEYRPNWSYMGHAAIFLLDTGLRLGEFVRLRKEHATLSKKGAEDGRWADSVYLPWGSTKSGKGRSIPLTRRAEAALAAILASPLHPTFDSNDPSAKRDGIDQNWLIRRWAAVRQEIASMGDVNLHKLRHTFASRLVQRGVDLYTVSKLLGHSTVTMTERYAHLAPTGLSNALSVLEPTPAHQPKERSLRVVK